MIIRLEIREMIEERILQNEYLLDEDGKFLDAIDKEEIYGKNLEEILDDEGKKLLDEYITALDKKYLIKEILAYLIGASDCSKMKNIFDEIQ